jgi:hypothetical protein
MSYFLAIYNRDSGTLIRALERYESDASAMQARFAAEAEFSGQRNIEIVALSAESEEALRRTHGRYF